MPGLKGVSATVQHGTSEIVYNRELSMHLEVSAYICGEIEPVTRCLAVPGKNNEVYVGVIEYEIEFAGEIQTFIPETLVHSAVDRNKGCCNRSCLEGAGKALYVLNGSGCKTLKVEFRIIRVLRPVHEGYRVPCVTLSPPEGLLSNFNREAGCGLKRKVCLVENSALRIIQV